ncbi:MAG: OadG family protein [Chloroflexi bacterium]|nr:OadG family protein [Chloroflexota bacterium]
MVSVEQVFAQGLVVTGAGMGLVFISLALLWLAMAVLGRLFRAPGEAPPPLVAPKEEMGEETVAVIAAAVSQALIRSKGMSPAPGASPSSSGLWKAAGRVGGMGGRGWRGGHAL